MSLFNSVLTAYATKVNGQLIDASDVNNLQTDVTQIEAILGVSGDASVVGSYEYFIKSPDSNGGGHVQTANKGGTGQTSFNKGDVLVAQSSSVLSKLAVSATDGYALVSDSTANTGVKWGLPGNAPNIRIYTPSVLSSTLSWLKPSVLSYVRVKLLGGGGGGGGAQTSAGGGGGAGGYSEKILAASSITTTSVLVYVGIGGTGGTGGANGTAGGSTAFGSYASVVGGSGGNNSGAGGAGGTVGAGTLNIAGQPGYGGVNGGVLYMGGDGGSTPFGMGGRGGLINAAGSDSGGAASVLGTGGGGAVASGSQGPTGGLGAYGTLIIEEY